MKAKFSSDSFFFTLFGCVFMWNVVVLIWLLLFFGTCLDPQTVFRVSCSFAEGTLLYACSAKLFEYVVCGNTTPSSRCSWQELPWKAKSLKVTSICHFIWILCLNESMISKVNHLHCSSLLTSSAVMSRMVPCSLSDMNAALISCFRLWI